MTPSWLYAENVTLTHRINALLNTKKRKELHGLNDSFYDMIDINIVKANALRIKIIERLKTLD